MDFSIKARLLESGFNPDAFEEGLVEMFRLAVGGLAKQTQDEWLRLANTRLGTSRDIYVNGLRQAESFKAMPRGSEMVFEIALVGQMPNNFEFGMPSFDMKAVRPGWLGGKKVKGDAGSRYVTIPFRHSTGDSPQMAYTGKAKAVSDPSLKQQLRTAVKTYGLDRMTRIATGQVVEGPTARIKKSAPVHPYLKGLTRYQKPTSGTTSKGLQKGSSTLMTFRRISENSPPDAWIHPGLDAANLLQDVERFVDSQLDRIIETIMGATG